MKKYPLIESLKNQITNSNITSKDFKKYHQIYQNFEI